VGKSKHFSFITHHKALYFFFFFRDSTFFLILFWHIAKKYSNLNAFLLVTVSYGRTEEEKYDY